MLIRDNSRKLAPAQREYIAAPFQFVSAYYVITLNRFECWLR